MRMQEMQPQIQAIQKKYRDNPQKMQEEFRKIGYNPTETLTGCLPLLLQFPILIGLYRAIIVLLGSTPKALFELTDMLYGWVVNAVDLADTLPIANRFLWMNLAQPDSLFILPFLVFASMFFQQRLLTPPKKKEEDGKKKQPDENPMAGMSQSMQWTMPIMFGFFSLSFPAGLSIYFVLSSVIGIAQGWLTKRSMEQEKAAKELSIGETTGIPEPEAAPVKPSSDGQKRAKSGKGSSKRKRKGAKR
jgi:YidC/Oxa1 family membrane protein insertase